MTNGSIEPLFRLRVRGALACLCAGGFFFLPPNAKAQEAPASTGQAIRVKVRRVNVGVVVTDGKGKFVEGLPREAFHVFDNGAEQPITEFAPLKEPGQVLLLVEAGPAVYLLQEANLFAAGAMLNGLSAQDRVAVVRYTDASLALLDFTVDKEAAQSVLQTIQFNLGYGDLNLSSSLVTVLGWLERVPGKKTIVLISTGVDTSPPSAVAVLQSRLQAGDVSILCISTSGPLRNGRQGGKGKAQQTQAEFQSADQQLQWLADTTGGRAYFPLNAKAFEVTYREVAQIVRHEYSLAFAPPVADGALHKIEVKVESGRADETSKPAAFRVDHRKGYIAPKE